VALGGRESIARDLEVFRNLELEVKAKESWEGDSYCLKVEEGRLRFKS